MFEEKIAMVNEMITEENKEAKEQAVTENTGAYGKRTYSVDEIQDILSIGRTAAYNLVKENQFRSVRVGGHIRISKKSFDEWLDAAC